MTLLSFVPRDLPLPLPAPQWFLEPLLVIAFLIHILFVNLMVGGTLLVFGLELLGLRRPGYDKLARQLAATVTVNKSLAVVLGVGPLLLIGVLYTIQFYTANALTGIAWLLLVPVISVTFLLLYLHKYSWDALADLKGVHLSIIGFAVALFLVIPLVFLANVNLMTFPSTWTKVRGFLQAVWLPNVLPRYFHFICASLVITSLFSVWFFGRVSNLEGLEPLTRSGIRRIFYSVALAVSLVQFIVGPVVLFTLPPDGLHVSVVLIILMGASMAVPAVWLMWKEVTMREPGGRRLPYIVGFLTLTVLCMGSGRHMYRAMALAQHRKDVREETIKWVEEAEQAEYEAKLGIQRAEQGVGEGQAMFEQTCAACHGVDEVRVGPPLTEIAQIYADNPDGIVTWAKAPGKKREGFPQMPAFATVGDERLHDIAEYMLETGAQ